MSLAPRRLSRLAAALYLVPTVLGPFSMMYVPTTVLVAGDAEATAARVAQRAALYRLGLASDVAIVLAEVALTALLYELARPVSRPLAVGATAARLGMTVLQAVNILPAWLALKLFTEAPSGDALALAQRHSLGLLATEAHALGVHLWEPLFALHLALLGAAMLRGRAVPRPFGVGLLAASVGYGANAFGALLVPSAASALAAFVGLTAVLGELPFVLWLLAKGVAEPRATAA